MVAQVVVPVCREDVERHSPEERGQLLFDRTRLAVVGHGERHLQVARRLPVSQGQHGHRRRVQAPGARGSIEAPRAERSVPAAEGKEPMLGDVNAGGAGELVEDPFACGHVPDVGVRRELGDPERPIVVSEARLGPGSAERAARRQEQREVVRLAGAPIPNRPLELPDSGDKLPQASQRRNTDGVIVEVAAVRPTEAERAHSGQVGDTKEVLPLAQRPARSPFRPGGNGFLPGQQRPPPSIGRGVGEHGRNGAVCRELVAAIQPVPRVDDEGIGAGDPRLLVRKREDRTTGCPHATQRADRQRAAKLGRIELNRDRVREIVPHVEPGRRRRLGVTAPSASRRPSSSSAAREARSSSRPRMPSARTSTPNPIERSPRSRLWSVARDTPMRSAISVADRRRRRRAARMRSPSAAVRRA